MNGRLESIWIKREHGGIIDDAETAVLDEGKGLEGDVNHGGRRQVTLLDSARWARAQEDLDAVVDPKLRRANLLLSGVPLAETTGRVLRIGETRLKINGETRPCGLMDTFHDGLREALVPDWGGGAHAEVLSGGSIRLGDPVVWEETPAKA